jgi:hypothetical protein
MVRIFVRVAQRRGLQLISKLTDDVIEALVPVPFVFVLVRVRVRASERPLVRALEFWQKMLDFMHEGLFSGCLFIYARNDSGLRSSANRSVFDRGGLLRC